MGYTCGKAVGEMKKIIVAVLVASGCMFSSVFAGQESQAPQQKKVIILIAEQNMPALSVRGGRAKLICRLSKPWLPSI